MEKVEIQKIIADFINEYVSLNNYECSNVDFSENEQGLLVTFETNNNGYFIGKNGSALKNLEIILQSVLRKNMVRTKLHLNIGSYRQDHDSKIMKIAIQKAEYVSSTGRPYTFEPMNSYERRLIHTAIQDSVYAILVRTESIGEGSERRTVIVSK